MKPLHQRATTKASQSARRKPAKTGPSKANSSNARLAILYTRLDKTKPGSKESKDIADQIIDAIG